MSYFINSEMTNTSPVKFNMYDHISNVLKCIHVVLTEYQCNEIAGIEPLQFPVLSNLL